MELLILWLLFGIIYSIYIYKLSYYYDYKYIGNTLRFVTVYIGSNMIFSIVLDGLAEDSMLSAVFSLILGLIICVLYRRFLILKFGKEERFANSGEIENIGTDKKEDKLC